MNLTISVCVTIFKIKMDPYKHLLDFSKFSEIELENEPKIDVNVEPITNFWMNNNSSNFHLSSCTDCTEFIESQVPKSTWNELSCETFDGESYRKSQQDRSYLIRQRFKIAVFRIIKVLKGPLKADADPYNRILFTAETSKNESKSNFKFENANKKELRELFKAAIEYVLIQCKVQKLTGDPYQRFFNIAIAALRRKKRHCQRKFSQKNLEVPGGNRCASQIFRSQSRSEIFQFPPRICTPDQLAGSSIEPSPTGSDAGSCDMQITVKESLSLPKLSGDSDVDESESINKVREKKTRFTLQNKVGGYDTIEIIHTKHRPIKRDDLPAVLERLCRPLNREVRSKVVKQLLKADRRHRPRKVFRPSDEVDRIVHRLYRDIPAWKQNAVDSDPVDFERDLRKYKIVRKFVYGNENERGRRLESQPPSYRLPQRLSDRFPQLPSDPLPQRPSDRLPRIEAVTAVLTSKSSEIPIHQMTERQIFFPKI